MKYYFILIIFVFSFISCQKEKDNPTETDEAPKEKIVEAFGFILNDFEVVHDTIKSGDTFGKILENFYLGELKSHQITERIKDSINLRNIRAGRPYTALLKKDNSRLLQALIYEADAINYFVVDVRDSIIAYKRQKPVKYIKRVIASEIEGSLSVTLDNAGTDPSLAHNLARIFEYSIDFFKIQKGDRFAVTFYEKYINDTIYGGVDRMEASFFVHKGKKFYAFPFIQDTLSNKVEYYDENANALKTMFLKAPLDYFRITSKFSPKRFHPVQKTWKAHRGTDYAAPQGTPIRTTASGVVERTGFTTGNGNYVKVKHNGTYATQYLHMSKILVRKGQRVSQGEVIGLVGSTGLATGPHVCYRFWKNGEQVDPLQEKATKSEPMETRHKPRFMKEMEPMKRALDSIAAKNFKD